MVDIPEKPTISWAKDEGLEISGVSASGAAIAADQKYAIYAKVGDEWIFRGSRDADPNDGPVFFNVFDFVEDGETITAVGVAVTAKGVEGQRAELAVSISRQDVYLESGFDVVVTDYPDNDDMMVTLTTEGKVFTKGAYYRLRHEKPTGEWDFHGSFIGNGSNTVVCNGPGEPGLEPGRWVVASYSENEVSGALNIGWEYAVNKGGSGTQLGTITYEKPNTWLAVADRDLDQEFRGYHLIGHQLRDVRMKFRLVTYDIEAVGDKYQFSETISAANLTAADDLTLSDDGDGFVKLSFSGGLKEYIVTYNDDGTLRKVVISVDSFPEDYLECGIDSGQNKANIDLGVYTLEGMTGQKVNVFYALYKEGRMVGIGTKNVQLSEKGFDDSITVNYAAGSHPDTCKAFILNEQTYEPVLVNLTKQP